MEAHFSLYKVVQRRTMAYNVLRRRTLNVRLPLEHGSDADFFLKKYVFLKIWPSKSGYRHLRRPKSLPRMRFSSLYDASPPRNIAVCVFDLDLGRKKTSLGEGATKHFGHRFFFQETLCFEDLA